MRKHCLLACVLATALLGGCASVPMTSASLDSEAKNFTPEPGKASIYVNRGGGIGTALVFQTVLDGRIVGSLAPHTYQLLSVPPGEHTLAVTSAENVEQMQFTADAGENYFFKVSVSMGWATGHARLEAIDEERGRKQVLSSKRAEATTYQ
ncbi:MAG: DUF2846 domain-containing protein [Phycisphaerales bacterium]